MIPMEAAPSSQPNVQGSNIELEKEITLIPEATMDNGEDPKLEVDDRELVG